MRSFTKYVHELIPLAQDARNLPHDIDELTILIWLVAGIGCTRSLLRGPRNNRLPNATGNSSMRSLVLSHQVIVLILLSQVVRVNRVILLLPILVRCKVRGLVIAPLEITTLVV